MAAALYGSGRSEEAIQEFQRAIAVDPNYTLALHNLALAYLDIGDDLAAAEDTIRQLEGVDPAYPGLASLRQQLEASRGDR
jgi:tetratricopeptide (TPR) repeat protein